MKLLKSLGVAAAAFAFIMGVSMAANAYEEGDVVVPRMVIPDPYIAQQLASAMKVSKEEADKIKVPVRFNNGRMPCLLLWKVDEGLSFRGDRFYLFIGLCRGMGAASIIALEPYEGS